MKRTITVGALLVIGFLILFWAVNLMRVRPQPSALPISMTQRPCIFKQGLWIKKYPGNFTCFKIETADGVKIITDPFYMDETVQADMVTISHKHYDHGDLSRISGTYKIINQVGTFVEKGVEVIGVEGYHNQDNLGQNNIYVFNSNGLRLAQFASQGCVPSEEKLNKIGKADILIIQIGEGYIPNKLSFSETADIIRRLQAKIIIPAHGNREGAAILSKLTEIKHLDLPKGELYVTKTDLSQLPAPVILVLDRPIMQ
jgi:hypothetical protein